MKLYAASVCKTLFVFCQKHASGQSYTSNTPEKEKSEVVQTRVFIRINIPHPSKSVRAVIPVKHGKLR